MPRPSLHPPRPRYHIRPYHLASDRLDDALDLLGREELAHDSKLAIFVRQKIEHCLGRYIGAMEFEKKPPTAASLRRELESFIKRDDFGSKAIDRLHPWTVKRMQDRLPPGESGVNDEEAVHQALTEVSSEYASMPRGRPRKFALGQAIHDLRAVFRSYVHIDFATYLKLDLEALKAELDDCDKAFANAASDEEAGEINSAEIIAQHLKAAGLSRRSVDPDTGGEPLSELERSELEFVHACLSTVHDTIEQTYVRKLMLSHGHPPIEQHKTGDRMFRRTCKVRAKECEKRRQKERQRRQEFVEEMVCLVDVPLWTVPFCRWEFEDSDWIRALKPKRTVRCPHPRSIEVLRTPIETSIRCGTSLIKATSR